MPRVAYTPQQKAEAVALATVNGAEAAGRALGIDPRTVRGWANAAGKAPADAVASSSWESLLALALARVGSALSTGKVSIRDASVVAGIAQRNIRQPAKPDAERIEEEAQQRARDRLGLTHVVARRMAHQLDVSLAELLDSLEENVGDPDAEALVVVAAQRYHQEHGCRWDEHQRPIGECPAPLANLWEWVDSTAPLDTWMEELDRARDAEVTRMIEANRERAEAARLASLDAETQRLLEAAEAFLRESADAA